MWSELINFLPVDCRWVFCGDWNFVERRQDKSKERTYLMTAEERQSF
jgi:hypothetical protein